MTFLKSIFLWEVSCSAHLYIISPRSSQKIVSREPRYFRALGGFAHTTFAHRKIFGASDFLTVRAPVDLIVVAPRKNVFFHNSPKVLVGHGLKDYGVKNLFTM